MMFLTKKFYLGSTLSLFCILLSSCGPSSEEIATMTASAWTSTPIPTSTATPAPTSTPTITPTATSTFTPTPTLPPNSRDDMGNVIIPFGGVIRIVVFDPTDVFEDHLIIGAKLAVEDMGSIQEFDIELIEIDDTCSEIPIDYGAAITDTDPMSFAVIGPLCSLGASQALPKLEEMKIVSVMPGATREDLPSLGPTVFNRVVQLEDEFLLAYSELSSVKDFLARLLLRGDVKPESIEGLGGFYALSYDATSVLLLAIEDSATLQDNGDLIISWQNLVWSLRRTENHEGLTGSITIDWQGNRVP